MKQRLVTDTNALNQPQDSYRRAYNVIKNRALGALSNEEGFERISITAYDIIYALAIDDDRLVLWAKEGAYSVIAVLDPEGNLDVRIREEALNFSMDRPMKAVYLRNFKKELTVIWVDGINHDRILNLDNIPFDQNGSKGLVREDDLALMRLAPGYNTANIKLLPTENSGGELKTGAYYFTSRYKLEDGSVTAPGFTMGPVHITDGSTRDGFFVYDGAPAGIPSGKSIKLSFTDTDSRYKSMEIIAVRKINSTLEAFVVAERPSGSDFEFTYRGNENHEEVSLEEVLVPEMIYDYSKTLTLHDNRLFRGNLKSDAAKDFNYQPYANDIYVDWVVDTVNLDQVEGSFKDPYTIFTKRGFFPDEVYAFYIRLYFENGTKSDAFHIPGPEATQADDYHMDHPANYSSVLDRISSIKSRGHLHKRSNLIDGTYTSNTDHLEHDLEVEGDIKFYQTRETAIDRSDRNMGVWYNEDEYYEDDAEKWGDLAGEQVRHHKFPSLPMLVDSNNPMVTGGGANALRASANSSLYLRGMKDKNNYGVAMAVPLTVDKSANPNIQGQSSFIMPSGSQTAQASIGDECWYYKTEQITPADVYIYSKMSSAFEPLFFINQVSQTETFVIDYDISFSHLVHRSHTKCRVRTQFGQFRRDGDKPFSPIDDAGQLKHYSLGEHTNPVSSSGETHEYKGTMTITLNKNESLALMIEYFMPDEATDDVWHELDFTFYRSDVKVRRLGEPENTTSEGKVLGIDVKNIKFPTEIQSTIKGYEILYAKRDTSNMRVVGQSLLFGTAPHPLKLSSLGSHAGNSPTTVARSESNANDSVIPTLRDDKVRFHAFDLLKDKPMLQPSYVKVGATLQGYRTGERQIEDKFWDPELASDDGRLSQDTPVQAHYRMDLVSTGDAGALNPVSEFNELRAVSNYRYIPADGIMSYGEEKLDNSYSEECAIFTVSHPNPQIQEQGSDKTSINGWFPKTTKFDHAASQGNDNTLQNYYLGSLYVHKRNVYTNLEDQELVSTGKLFKVVSPTLTQRTYSLFGGDTFFSLYGIRLTAALFYGLTKYVSIDKNEALKNIFYFPCYTVSNVALRHSGGTYKDNYYPAVGTNYSSYDEWLTRPADNANTNSFTYNDDYTSVGDLASGTVYNQKEEFLSEFPFRVARGVAYDPENKYFTLRKFLANDYKEMPKNRGEIINLESYATALMIHMKYSLMRTVSKETIATSERDAEVGTGDIFRMEPSELLTTEHGYAGTQHMGACLVSPLGYLSIDADQGKISLFNGKLNEISGQDMRNYFRDEFILKLKEQLDGKEVQLNTYDNPFAPGGVGYTTAFDRRWNRIIITKIDKVLKIPSTNLSLTVSAGDSLVVREGKFQILNGTTLRDLEPSDEEIFFDDVSETISFDGQSWISWHNYAGKVMANTRNEVYSFKGGDAYLHNQPGTYGKFYDGEIFPCTLDVSINPQSNITKLYQSLQWISEVTDGSRFLHDKTISQVLLYNNYQCSDYISIEPMVNARNNEGTWSFNEFRDIVLDKEAAFMESDEPIPSNLDPNMPWFNQRRFTDKFVVVRVLYDNIDQNALYLYSLEASILRSHR
ncbi:hypothetical protein PP178_03995 [Zeaxanthinibacter sp. PT1]|uniref:hypothetical protein n=1 Tax=Zeaxanthinibacter TaxID=561554 RepID=UPI00234ADCE5|nr:hypothetical protein [Zeaxanthinibacter sp. PT1]MDC6350702.1 hypothetical protein [Zeaxanthinibacter sp. PT1]